MSATVAALILILLCTPHALGQKNKKREDPIEKIQPLASFDPRQFAGKWYLLSVSSECNYLKLNNHRVEATIMKVSPSKNKKGQDRMLVSTFRNMDAICWEIKHEYLHNKAKGRFLLKARGYGMSVDIVVAETDYQNYAILYYQRMRKITVKLYGRKTSVTDDIYRKFDEHVTKQGFDLELIYPFPTYGFCEEANEFHILNGKNCLKLFLSTVDN
ncbi:complement component C8 gamma chain [Rhinophrynus dorsalis]